MDFLGQLPQQLVNGITLGSIYGLIALGYSMVYGILEILNFAHGEVYMVGAFAGWVTLQVAAYTGILPWSPMLTIVLMLVLSMAFCALLGVSIERFAYRPLRGVTRLAPLIAALGVSIFLQNAIMLPTGAKPYFYPTQQLLPDWTFAFGSIHITFGRLMMIVVAFVLMIALDFFIRRTLIGAAMRATAQDQEAAQYVGINVNRVISVTFFIGSALAGTAGVLVGLYFGSINFAMGFTAGMKAFTAAVLGGIGNLRGAMLGGLLLGLVESLGIAFISPVYKDVIAFSVLILVLVFKPTGLLGEQLPDKV